MTLSIRVYLYTSIINENRENANALFCWCRILSLQVHFEIGESESGIGTHSDNERRNRRGRVRSRCSFRQKERKSEEASPKSALIRTVGVETGEEESEVGADSDNGMRNRRG